MKNTQFTAFILLLQFTISLHAQKVIFSETFENKTVGNDIVPIEFDTTWNMMRNSWNRAYDTVKVINYSGNNVFHQSVGANTTGANGGFEIKVNLGGRYDEIWISMDARVKPGFDFYNENCNTDDDPEIEGGGGGKWLGGVNTSLRDQIPWDELDSSATGYTGYSASIFQGGGKYASYTQDHTLPISTPDIKYFAHGVDHDDIEISDFSTWHNVTIRFVMNTPGVADGYRQTFYDGTLVGHASGYMWRSAQQAIESFSHMRLWFFFGGVCASSRDEWIELDDITAYYYEPGDSEYAVGPLPIGSIRPIVRPGYDRFPVVIRDSTHTESSGTVYASIGGWPQPANRERATTISIANATYIQLDFDINRWGLTADREGNSPWVKIYDGANNLIKTFDHADQPDAGDHIITIQDNEAVIEYHTGDDKANMGWVFDYTSDAPPTSYDLLINTAGHGNISHASGSYPTGSNLTIIAFPVSGWSFDGWTGDVQSSNDTISVTMSQDIDITATFTPNSPPVIDTIIIEVSDDSYIRGGINSNTNYGSLSMIETRYNPDDTYKRQSFFRFDASAYNFDSVISATFNVHNSTSTSDVLQTFNKVADDNWSENTITWDNAPLEYGIVGNKIISSPGWYQLDITDFFTEQWSYDKKVTVKSKTLNSTVVQYSSRENINDNKAFIEIIAVTWNFDDTSSYYNLTVDNTGQGTVVPGSGTFPDGTNVTLIATPAQGWCFDEWTGDVQSSNDTISVTMNADVNVTAHFIEDTISPSTSDTVYPEADAYVRGGNYAGNNYGSESSLVIKNSSPDYTRISYIRFDLQNTGVIQSAILKLNKIDGTANETMSVYLMENDSWGEASINYNNRPTAGSLISNVSIPSGSSLEIDVTDEVIAEQSDGKITIMLTGTSWSIFFSRETANEEYRPQLAVTYSGGTPTYDLTMDTSGQGSVTPGSGAYPKGDTVQIIATPAPGWAFNGWTGDVVDNNDTIYITMDEDISITATFEEVENFVVDTIAFAISEDTYVHSGIPNNNYGNSGDASADEYQKTALIKIDLDTCTFSSIQKATLHLHYQYILGGIRQIFHEYSDNWSETTVTYNNAPTLAGDVVARIDMSSNGWYEVDITNYAIAEFAGDGVISMFVKDSIDLAAFNTLEKTDNNPYVTFVVEYPTLKNANLTYLKKIEPTDKKIKLNVAPNPSNGKILVKMSHLESASILRVTDLSGTILYQEHINLFNGQISKSIDLSSFPDGIYFVVLTSLYDKSIRKIILK